MLQNRIYIGEIVHKDTSYPGKHDGIVDRSLWDRVQDLLADNRVKRVSRSSAQSPSLLAGIIYDDHSQRLTPSHAVKNGKRYRYYVSQTPISDNESSVFRLPAPEIETLVVRGLQNLLGDEVELLGVLGLDDSGPSELKSVFGKANRIAACLASKAGLEPRAIVQTVTARVIIGDADIRITLDVAQLRATLQVGGSVASSDDPELHEIVIPAALKRCGRGGKLIVGQADWRQPAKDPILIKTIKRAHHWLAMLLDGDAKSVRDIARREDLTHSYVSRLLPLAFLAPDITEAILKGQQPPELTAERLTRIPDLPLYWPDQRSMLGFN